MMYIKAKQLVERAVSREILKEDGKGNIAVYKEFKEKDKNGWYWVDREEVIQDVMRNETAQKLLNEAINTALTRNDKRDEK